MKDFGHLQLLQNIYNYNIQSEELKHRFLTISRSSLQYRHNKVRLICEMVEQGHSKDHHVEDYREKSVQLKQESQQMQTDQ